MSEAQPTPQVLAEYRADPQKKELSDRFVTVSSQIPGVIRILLIPDNYYHDMPRTYVVAEDNARQSVETAVEEICKEISSDPGVAKSLGPVCVATERMLDKDMFLFFRVIDNSEIGVLWERQGRLL